VNVGVKQVLGGFEFIAAGVEGGHLFFDPLRFLRINSSEFKP
jgi:hypothetical protein